MERNLWYDVTYISKKGLYDIDDPFVLYVCIYVYPNIHVYIVCAYMCVYVYI